MIPALREEFNRNFTPEKYRQFLLPGSGQRHAHWISRLRDAMLRTQRLSRPDGRSTVVN